MKNKHLVLLFLLTLLIGLAVRRAPWRQSQFFQTKLLQLDTAEIVRIETRAQHFMRHEDVWSVEQGNRSTRMPPEASQEMLATLADLRSIRIVKTGRPDTLGLSKPTAITVQIIPGKGRTEILVIGNETLENGRPATFVELPKHKGIYLAENHLRKFFSKTLQDYRSAANVQLRATDVQGFSIFRRGLDSLVFQKNDTADIWETSTSPNVIPGEKVRSWLANIETLKKLPFADLFDETHASKTLYAQIDLQIRGESEPLSLKIYQLNTESWPEDLPEKPFVDKQLAPYALYFSPYPTNYYALTDTTLLRKICQPFKK